jgi:hypothetical protein
VRRELAKVNRRLAAGKLEPSAANAQIYALATIIRCLQAMQNDKLDELEQRCAALEAAERARRDTFDGDPAPCARR